MLRRAWLLAGVLCCGCDEAENESDVEDAGTPDQAIDASMLPLALDAGGPRLVRDAAPADAGPQAGLDAGSADRPWNFCASVFAKAGLRAPAADHISWAKLLCETADLDRFTYASTVGYRGLMASSHDRASKVEGGDGWFANADSANYVRSDGEEHVMMEARGPGAITRLWSANPSGRLRVYIDDAIAPAIDIDMEAFFAGTYAPAFAEPFVFEAADGHSSYFPIPYARYARVTTTANNVLYYQIDYRDYPDGTVVEPFSRAGLTALEPVARELAAFTADPGAWAPLVELPSQVLSLSADSPSQRVALGPAVVRELSVRGFDPALLRTTRLIVLVDGETTIDAPLGDLFGTGPGLHPFRSLPAEITPDALLLRWPMPVRREFSVRAETSTGQLAPLQVQLRWSRGAPGLARTFHARWTGTQTFASDQAKDWTLLHVNGDGWYVGTLLNVNNAANVWWGEGDEKIFVDGETFPSHFGTGTEDYFGLGWCSTELVAKPWLGQTRADGPANAGRTSDYRWHVADAIPFRRSLRFRLEVLHWFNKLFSVPVTQDAVAYWYAMPGSLLDAAALDTSDFQVTEIQSLAAPAGAGPSTCKP